MYLLVRDEVWGVSLVVSRGRLGCEKVVSLQLLVMVEIRGEEVVGGEFLIVYAVESSFLV